MVSTWVGILNLLSYPISLDQTKCNIFTLKRPFLTSFGDLYFDNLFVGEKLEVQNKGERWEHLWTQFL